MWSGRCSVRKLGEYLDVSKNRGKTPKMDGKNFMENPMNKWMIWGVFPLCLVQHTFSSEIFCQESIHVFRSLRQLRIGDIVTLKALSGQHLQVGNGMPLEIIQKLPPLFCMSQKVGGILLPPSKNGIRLLKT